MSVTKSENTSLTAGLFLTAANAVPIWLFRFLPLYDYPIWLFETRVLREYSNPVLEYWKQYEIVLAPIPNLGFLGITWLLSWLVSYEVAGKLFLTLCVTGLPWSFWYCVRSVSEDPQNTLAFAAFPFAFNLYFYMGNSFLFGLVLLFWIVGFFVPKLNSMSVVQWLFLSCLLFTSYLIHALSFGLTVFLLVSSIAFRKVGRGLTLVRFLFALLPSGAALVWYIGIGTRIPADQLTWGLWTVGQNILKPMFLFVKTWGIPNAVPLTLLNVGWLVILLAFVCTILVAAVRTKNLDVRFVFPALVCISLAFFLPRQVLGIDQIGARFVLPALFMLLLGISKYRVQKWWGRVFLGMSFIVLSYNAFHFYRTNQQSTDFAEDLHEFTFVNETMYLVHFDWSAWTGVGDIGSSSVNPLFGVPYYDKLIEPGTEAVHETSIVRMRKQPAGEGIPFDWGERERFVESVIANAEALRAYDVVALVAEREIAQRVVTSLTAHQFSVLCVRDYWTLLRCNPEVHVKP